MLHAKPSPRLLLICPNSSPFPWRGFRDAYRETVPAGEFHIMLHVAWLWPLAGDDFSDFHFIDTNDYSVPSIEAITRFNNDVPSANHLIIKDRWLTKMDRNEATKIVINLYTKINVFLDANAFDGLVGEVASAMTELWFIACQRRGIQYFWPMASFFPNRFFIFPAEDEFGFRKLIKQAISKSDSSLSAEEELEFATYFENQLKNFSRLTLDVSLVKRVALGLASFSDSVRGLLSNLKVRLLGRSAYYSDALITLVSGVFVKTSRVFWGDPLRADFNIPTVQKYFLYFLHYDPDLATLQWAPNYCDQIAQIRKISENLPSGTVLVVKEHPLSKLIRPRQFYRDINKISNVILLSSAVPRSTLLAGCTAVVTLTGTIGFEAWIFGKPVICLGTTFYDELSGVFVGKDYDVLRQIMYELAVNGFEPLHVEERRKICRAIYGSSSSGRYNEFEKYEKHSVQEIKRDLKPTYQKMIDCIVKYMK